jgi:uncharacterized membrane protein YkoI
MPARRIILAAFLALAASAPSAHAGPRVIEPEWVMPVQDRENDRQRILPLREVLDMLRARYGGEYVSHRLEDGGHPVYVIRWRMPDGVTTRDFRVDAVSGQFR